MAPLGVVASLPLILQREACNLLHSPTNSSEVLLAEILALYSGGLSLFGGILSPIRNCLQVSRFRKLTLRPDPLGLLLGLLGCLVLRANLSLLGGLQRLLEFRSNLCIRLSLFTFKE